MLSGVDKISLEVSLVVMKSQTLATCSICHWYTWLQPPGASVLRLQLPCWLAAHAHPVLNPLRDCLIRNFAICGLLRGAVTSSILAAA